LNLILKAERTRISCLAVSGVMKTYAIQAGRELRVIGRAEKVTDKEAEDFHLRLPVKFRMK